MLEQGPAQDLGDGVAEAREGQEDQCGPQGGAEAEAGDRQAPQRDRADQGASGVVDPAGPAAGQGPAERADRGGGVEQADGGGSAAEVLGAEFREQRVRHGEDHGAHVDQQQPGHDLVAAQEPQPLPHGLQRVLRLPGPLGREAGQRGEQGQTDDVDDGVGREAQRDARPGRDDAREGGPGHGAELGGEGHQRPGGGELARGHQGGGGGHEGGSAESTGAAREDGRHEHEPQLRVGQGRVHRETRDHHGGRGPGDEHDPAPVDPVGEHTARDQPDQQRQPQRQAHQAYLDRGPGQFVDLDAGRDRGEVRAQHGDRLGGEQQPEVPARSQGRDVDDDFSQSHLRT